MAVSRSLLAALRAELVARAEAKAAPQMQAYMKSAMPFYGVHAPELKALCRRVFAQYPLTSYEHWRDTTLQLWRKAQYREERYCALALCNARQYLPYQGLASLDIFEEFIVTGAWWDLVDGLAPYRLRYLLETETQATRAILKRWAKDGNIWKRRSAILSQLRRKADTDLPLLYTCIEPSLGSKEFFLQKAIGWALRDYAWTNAPAVLDYVSGQGDRLSPLSRREALKNIGKAPRKVAK